MSDWWGTAPAWVSAIGTSGSLLMGFTILLRDRRKEERAEAQKVVVYVDDRSPVSVHLMNTSDRPISNPVLYLGSAIGWVGTLRFDRPRVAPGTELELELPPEAAEVDAYPVGVQFFDADGYVWLRDVRTGKVKREGAVHRGAGVSWFDMRPVMRMAKGGRPHSLWARDKMPWIPPATSDDD